MRERLVEEAHEWDAGGLADLGQLKTELGVGPDLGPGVVGAAALASVKARGLPFADLGDYGWRISFAVSAGLALLVPLLPERLRAGIDVLEGNYGGDPTKMPYVVNMEAFSEQSL